MAGELAEPRAGQATDTAATRAVAVGIAGLGPDRDGRERAALSDDGDLGIVTGAALTVLTWFMLLKGAASPNLEVLSEYLPGYTVTPMGSIVGLAYGFSYGFLIGWLYALLRNSGMILTLVLAHKRLERKLMRDLFRYF